MTLSELSSEFYNKYMLQRLRPATIRGYLVNLQKHILPQLGNKNINQITVEDLDDLTADLQHTLSNKSIVYVHATLRKMYVFAIKRQYTEKTPYTAFDLPRVEKYRYKVLNEQQIKIALACAENTTIEVPLTLALCYGLRRGEVLGIIPTLDVDPYNNVLHIQRTRSKENGLNIVTPCKTEQSNRFLLLNPKHTKLLLRAGRSGEYAFPYSPAVLDTTFKQFCKSCGFENLRFHDLRHSYATYMLSKGVNPKIVSNVLGHSGVDITLDIYSHPDVSMQKICLEVF